MNRLSPLPHIMVAPNGARRGKADHPDLPLSIADTVAAARASFAAGAKALHAHVRDADGRHVLDPNRYKALIAAMAEAVPDMPVQITSEAVGIYSPEAQRDVVLAVGPEGASVALREMWPETADAQGSAAARDFYATCAQRDIAIQHICYAPADLARLLILAREGDLPQPLQAIFVLGSYAESTAARPADLTPFLDLLSAAGLPVDWALCAFGAQETACLCAAHRAGGKLRIGFENNLLMADGRVAPDNAARVRELMAALRTPTDPDARGG